MEATELGFVEVPLPEVPTPLQWQRLGVHAALGGDEVPKPDAVVSADSVEVNTEDEPAHGAEPSRRTPQER